MYFMIFSSSKSFPLPIEIIQSHLYHTLFLSQNLLRTGRNPGRGDGRSARARDGVSSGSASSSHVYWTSRLGGEVWMPWIIC